MELLKCVSLIQVAALPMNLNKHHTSLTGHPQRTQRESLPRLWQKHQRQSLLRLPHLLWSSLRQPFAAKQLAGHAPLLVAIQAAHVVTAWASAASQPS